MLRGWAQALNLIGDVDELICLGDSIWEYRFSNEIVSMLKERGAHTILGNHEEGFLGPHGARARQADWIDRSLLRWLAERPHRLNPRPARATASSSQARRPFMKSDRRLD